jgi:hypothetical protein
VGSVTNISLSVRAMPPTPGRTRNARACTRTHACTHLLPLHPDTLKPRIHTHTNTHTHHHHHRFVTDPTARASWITAHACAKHTHTHTHTHTRARLSERNFVAFRSGISEKCRAARRIREALSGKNERMTDPRLTPGAHTHAGDRLAHRRRRRRRRVLSPCVRPRAAPAHGQHAAPRVGQEAAAVLAVVRKEARMPRTLLSPKARLHRSGFDRGSSIPPCGVAQRGVCIYITKQNRTPNGHPKPTHLAPWHCRNHTTRALAATFIATGITMVKLPEEQAAEASGGF